MFEITRQHYVLTYKFSSLFLFYKGGGRNYNKQKLRDTKRVKYCNNHKELISRFNCVRVGVCVRVCVRKCVHVCVYIYIGKTWIFKKVKCII